MRKVAIGLCLAAWATTAVALVGCGGGPGDEDTLSVRADDDPARLQKAQAEVADAAKRAREAEARKLKGAPLVENP
jgi:hypothetical protein